MFINQNTAITTRQILLVPYEKHHVSTYHEWMANPDLNLQEMTASEPLSLGEEFEMQIRWRGEGDKITFITCLSAGDGMGMGMGIGAGMEDREERMVGDVNLFLERVLGDGDGNEKSSKLIGEIEVMIAPISARRKGYGRAAVLAFLRYISSHEKEILEEYGKSKGIEELELTGLVVKIGESNVGSLRLFEELGFRKVRPEPSYFGEFELFLTRVEWEEMMRGDGEGYAEVPYLYLEKDEKGEGS